MKKQINSPEDVNAQAIFEKAKKLCANVIEKAIEKKSNLSPEEIMSESFMAEQLESDVFSDVFKNITEEEEKSLKFSFQEYLENTARTVLSNKEQIATGVFFILAMAMYLGYITKDSSIINEALEAVNQFNQATQNAGNNFVSALVDVGAMTALARNSGVTPLNTLAYAVWLSMKNNLVQADSSKEEKFIIPDQHHQAWQDIHYKNLGNSFHETGQYAQAIEAYQEAIKINPNVAQYHRNLGNSFYESGQYEQAIKAYQEAIKINPNVADYHNNLGVLFYQTGQYAQAIEAHQEAIKINPNVAQYHRNLGNSFYESGQYEQAIKAYQEAIKINPNIADYHSNLGNSFHQSGQYAQAIKAYQEAIKINPNVAQYHRNLGISFHQNGQYAQAIEAHQEAIKINPNVADYHSNLGVSFHESGQYAQAIEAYRKAIKINPNVADYHINLGVSFHQSGQYVEAMEELANYHKLMGRNKFLDPRYVELMIFSAISQGADFIKNNLSKIIIATVTLAVINEIYRCNDDLKKSNDLKNNNNNLQKWSNAYRSQFDLSFDDEWVDTIRKMSPNQLNDLLKILDGKNPAIKNPETFSQVDQKNLSDIKDLLQSFKKVEFDTTIINIGQTYGAVAATKTNSIFHKALKILKADNFRTPQMAGLEKLIRTEYGKTPNTNPVAAALVKTPQIQQTH